MRFAGRLWVLLAVLILSLPGAATAQAPFYKDKTLTIVVPFGTGALYSDYSLLVAKHIGRHIPGEPDVIVEHMPGAGGVKSANYLYNDAVQDGTVIGMAVKDLALNQLLNLEEPAYDAGKFKWIGRVDSYMWVLWVTPKAGVNSIEDAKSTEIVLGAAGKASGSWIHPHLMNRLVGTKFKIVTGYKGAASLNEAALQNEIHGWANRSLDSFLRPGSRPDLLADGRAIILMQHGSRRHEAIPDVPLFKELAPDDKARAVIELVDSAADVGFSMYAPPGVEEDQVAVLREAFDKTMMDPAFLADVSAAGAEIDPASGVEAQTMIETILSTPSEIVERTRKLIQ